MESYKEYIINIIKNEKLSPKQLFTETKKILENYVEETTDSTLRPVLYNDSYGGYSLSDQFRIYYLNRDKSTIIYKHRSGREIYYEHIVNNFVEYLEKDDKMKKKFYEQYVVDKYKIDIVKSHVQNEKRKKEQREVNQNRLKIVQDYILQGKFGNVETCEYRDIDIGSYLRGKTEKYAKSVEKEIKMWIERESKNETHFKIYEKSFVQGLQEILDSNNAKTLFKKLVELSENKVFENEDIPKKFDIFNMKWFDPVKNKIEHIDEKIYKKSRITVALNEASGPHCKLNVAWIPKNKGFEIAEYDGKESVYAKSVLDS